MVDKTLGAVAQVLSYLILGLMAVLVLGSIFARRGSLDDLPADKIREAVEHARS